MQIKKYNVVNDLMGWFAFLVAAITYLLTVEPTASFWDCPEFISQGAKLEVGHPPGNPFRWRHGHCRPGCQLHVGPA